jgi:hypothetical protein
MRSSNDTDDRAEQKISLKRSSKKESVETFSSQEVKNSQGRKETKKVKV